MDSGLSLLARDGAIVVYFSPQLSGEQCDELSKVIEQPATKAELCETLRELAKRWGTEVVIDE